MAAVLLKYDIADNYADIPKNKHSKSFLHRYGSSYGKNYEEKLHR